ncbi:MAG: ribose 5-phosphate isomerase B [Oscillospiraceae bacterium]|nr:ribose 5-phosphate isomerase B [Oscillospiraceae bacterium]
MKIALGCDHGGYELMQEVKKHLEGLGIEYADFGTYGLESCHYPVFGEAAARAVQKGECELGIVICTTGIGISITANKVHGIRCALCADTFSAEMTRRHNDANMLAMGAAVVGKGLALKIVDAFLGAQFEGGRHATRVGMIGEVEAKG